MGIWAPYVLIAILLTQAHLKHVRAVLKLQLPGSVDPSMHSCGRHKI